MFSGLWLSLVVFGFLWCPAGSKSTPGSLVLFGAGDIPTLVIFGSLVLLFHSLYSPLLSILISVVLLTLGLAWVCSTEAKLAVSQSGWLSQELNLSLATDSSSILSYPRAQARRGRSGVSQVQIQNRNTSPKIRTGVCPLFKRRAPARCPKVEAQT